MDLRRECPGYRRFIKQENSAEVSGLAEIQPQVYRFLEDDSSVGAFIFSLGDIFILLVFSSCISDCIPKQVICIFIA